MSLILLVNVILNHSPSPPYCFIRLPKDASSYHEVGYIHFVFWTLYSTTKSWSLVFFRWDSEVWLHRSKNCCWTKQKQQLTLQILSLVGWASASLLLGKEVRSSKEILHFCALLLVMAGSAHFFQRFLDVWKIQANDHYLFGKSSVRFVPH